MTKYGTKEQAQDLLKDWRVRRRIGYMWNIHTNVHVTRDLYEYMDLPSPKFLETKAMLHYHYLTKYVKRV